MKTKFNSQICTTREQSESLLALGLRKETADMMWANCKGNSSGTTYYLAVGTPHYNCDIPAWSLHRLIEMMPKEINRCNNFYLLLVSKENVFYQTGHPPFRHHDSLYDNIIDCIEWLIKEGYFNKEYLV